MKSKNNNNSSHKTFFLFYFLAGAFFTGIGFLIFFFSRTTFRSLPGSNCNTPFASLLPRIGFTLPTQISHQRTIPVRTLSLRRSLTSSETRMMARPVMAEEAQISTTSSDLSYSDDDLLVADASQAVDKTQSASNSETSSELSQGSEDQGISNTTPQEVIPYSDEETGDELALVPTVSEKHEEEHESVLKPTTSQELNEALEAWGYKPGSSSFHNKSESSQSSTVITQQNRGLPLENNDCFVKFADSLKNNPYFEKAITILKNQNKISQDFLNTEITLQTKLYASDIKAINAISEQLQIFTEAKNIKQILMGGEFKPYDDTLNVQVNYRGLKNKEGAAVIDMFTTTGNYQSCKNCLSTASDEVARVNKIPTPFPILNPTGLDFSVKECPKLVFVKGECDHVFGKFIRTCLNETTSTTGPGYDQCQTVVVSKAFHTERESWIKKIKPYEDPVGFSYNTENGIDDLLDSWQMKDHGFIKTSKNLQGIDASDMIESYDRVRLDKKRELATANPLRVPTKKDQLVVYHANVIYNRGLDLIHTIRDSYIAGRTSINLFEANGDGANLAKTYIRGAFQDAYYDALVRSRFPKMIEAAQGCSPKCEQVLANLTNSFLNTVTDRLIECEFEGYVNQEVNFTDFQLPAFINEKCKESGNQKITDDQAYAFGKEFFGTNNPSIKGSKSTDLAHVFSKNRYSTLMKTVSNEEQLSNHCADNYAFYQREINNSIEGEKHLKQNHNLERLICFPEKPEKKDVAATSASANPPLAFQQTHRPLLSDQSQSEITSSALNQEVPEIQEIEGSSQRARLPQPVTSPSEKASLEQKDPEKVKMGSIGYSKSKGKSLKNSFKKIPSVEKLALAIVPERETL